VADLVAAAVVVVMVAAVIVTKPALHAAQETGYQAGFFSPVFKVSGTTGPNPGARWRVDH
jgi:hypothetical protein